MAPVGGARQFGPEDVRHPVNVVGRLSSPNPMSHERHRFGTSTNDGACLMVHENLSPGSLSCGSSTVFMATAGATRRER
jgi:hypothetical protein